MHRITPKRALLAALAAALIALALPAAAPAALTSAPGVNTVTLTGDAGNDNLIIDDNGALLTHNQTGGGFHSATDFDTTLADNQTLPATNVVTVNVIAGDGNDSIRFDTTAVASAVLAGEGGDDLLVGTDGGDLLDGGEGDDRIVGFRGGDTMLGGNGNDTLVWNNGDGTDDMDGEGGNADVVEVNGSPNGGDVFTIAPGPLGRVDFDRTGAGAFSLNIGTAERIQVNGGNGDDSITSLPGAGALIQHELNGQNGADTIVGSTSNDLITGGDGIDALSGGDGNDRIVGDRANDVMNGEGGDDTLVWNNGDGTDAMNGGSGTDRAEVNGNAAGNETFAVKPAGAGARFDRTSTPGAFGLDLVATEQLELNALGGNDSLDVAAATPLDVTADLGAGDDTATVRNSLLDVVRCGTGTDKATVDLADFADGCESVDRPVVTPAPAVVQPPAAIVEPPAQVVLDKVALPAVINANALRLGRNGRDVAFELSCPPGEAGGCNVVARLETATGVTIGGVKLIAQLGVVRANLRAGEKRRVVVRLPARLARVLARRNRVLRLRAEILTRDSAGNVAETTKRLTLRLGGRRR